MEEIRNYLISVVAVCMIPVLAGVLIQKSALQKIVRLLGGVLILLVAIRPLLSLDTDKITSYLEEFHTTYRFDTGRIKTSQDALLRQRVKQTAETFIENEAKEIGGTVQAEITLSEDEYPVPFAVRLTGTLTPEQVRTVSAYIENTLNIPPGRQEWRLYD